MRAAHASDARFSFVAHLGGAENGGHAGMRILHATPPNGKENAMDLSIRTPNLALDAWGVITVDDAEGLRIIARRGTVWVTEEGVPVERNSVTRDALCYPPPCLTAVQAPPPPF